MAQQATFGLYRTRDQVESAVDELRAHAVRLEDISALFPDNVGTRESAREKRSELADVGPAGATTVAIMGGTLGRLIDVGALHVPGAGAFIAAGPIMHVIRNVADDASAVGLTSMLVGVGIPAYKAARYERRVQEGSILVSVRADDSDGATLAKAILKRTGADDVASTDEEAASRNTDRSPPSVHRTA